MKTAVTYSMLAELCDRKLGMRDVACFICGPARRSPENRKRRVLRIWHTEPGFASFCCARCGKRGFARGGDQFVSAPRGPKMQSVADDDGGRERRRKIALGIWTSSAPLPGTLGWFYLTDRRGLNLNGLGDLNHVLRWSAQAGAVAALMSDPITNEPVGVHRTFLTSDGTKCERKMLGKMGVVRLSRDEDVTQGLGIVEGVEDGLAVLISGWAPIWCATSAGAIERFPVICGIESLTIFSDSDAPGMQAARACAARWNRAGREARLCPSGALSHAA